MKCSAMVRTFSGDWHFFDTDALQTAFSTFGMPPKVRAGAGADAVGDNTGAEVDVTIAGDRLLDGFTVEQWACYAKRKARSASAVCKGNGLMPDAGVRNPNVVKELDDSLLLNDPWPGKSCSGNVNHSVVSRGAGADGDPWADWKRVSVEDEQAGSANEDQQTEVVQHACDDHGKTEAAAEHDIDDSGVSSDFVKDPSKHETVAGHDLELSENQIT